MPTEARRLDRRSWTYITGVTLPAPVVAASAAVVADRERDVH